MNHIHYHPALIHKLCNPEQNLAVSESNGEAQSKDPYGINARRGESNNFRTVVRFFDEQDAELVPVSANGSDESTVHSEPRSGERVRPPLKPWVGAGNERASEGRRNTPSHDTNGKPPQ